MRLINDGVFMNQQETDYIALTNDLLFHMVFTRNLDALKGLLAVMLNLPELSIKEIEVLNPMQYSEVKDSKLTILDLKVHMNSNTFIHVEMQVRKFEYWTNRTVSYACRQIADQIQGKFDYSKLEPVIQISIMDCSLFPEHKRFFSKYVPRDDEGYPYTDKLQFIVMDLTQIGSANEDQKKQGLVEWAMAFKADSWEEVGKINNHSIKEAVKTMQLIMSNPSEKEKIRMREDARRDEITTIAAAERRGKEEGRREGIKQGIEQAMWDYARRMKNDGMDEALISKYTGLTADQVSSL